MPRRNDKVPRRRGGASPLATRQLMEDLTREWAQLERARQRREEARRQHREWQATQRRVDHLRATYSTTRQEGTTQ